MTGAETARALLRFQAPHVLIYCDNTNERAAHYDPKRHQIGLGRAFYFGDHIEAIAAAAHEAGHALQHRRAYLPFEIRRVLWPAAHNLGKILPIVLVLALLLHLPALLHFTLWSYVGLLVFHLLTLPIEFDASRRAIRGLILGGIAGNEIGGGGDVNTVRKILRRAAWSYVAAFLTAPWQVIKQLRG